MITFASIQEATVSQSETTPEDIELAAIIDTALCVGAGGSSGSLADKPILRDAQRRLIIPASQLKGRLRHECEKLARALHWPVCESPVAENMCPQRANASKAQQNVFKSSAYKLKQSGNAAIDQQYHCLICQLFGNPSLPARLQFSDLVCDQPADNLPEVLRPGVSINRRRRTAEEQKLYFLETSPVNAGLAFTGTLQIQPPWPLVEGASPQFEKAFILTGLKHTYALGGGKSTGLGWLRWDFDLGQMAIADEVWHWLSAPPRQPKTAGADDRPTGGESK